MLVVVVETVTPLVATRVVEAEYVPEGTPEVDAKMRPDCPAAIVADPDITNVPDELVRTTNMTTVMEVARLFV